ncbi:MAG: hypothetical protein K0S99_2478, partial [Thermomicrobiales bacterium]|nr:hypothetical protein [Thermomicrobiales bacterium]
VELEALEPPARLRRQRHHAVLINDQPRALGRLRIPPLRATSAPGRGRWGCLIAPQQSRQSLQSHYTLSRLLRCSENWPRLSAERSRVAGAPRGPGSVRSSRPHRGWGSGAQARSQRRSPASRPRRVRVVGSGQACAGFTVVSAVGTGPPHDGPSRDRPSKVSGAVRDGRRPIGGMASPTSPAGTSRVSDDGRNTGTRWSAHGLYS